MDASAEDPSQGQAIRQDLFNEAVAQLFNELFSHAAGFDGQANVSLLSESITRLCNADPIERCEDPLVQARCTRLSWEKQRKLTPSRFPQLSGSGQPELSRSSGGYESYSPGDREHPGKRKATSPPPEQLDREMEIMEPYISLRRQKRALRAEQGKKKRHAPENSHIVQARGWRLEQAPITGPGWQGRHALPKERAKLCRMLEERDQRFMAVLASFTRIHYDVASRAPTRVVDCEGRLFIYRSRLSKWLRDLLPELAKAIATFTENTIISDAERANNKRGPQNFCIAGVDRQSKGRPAMSSWHRKGNNHAELLKLFETQAMKTFNQLVTGLVRMHFPAIAKRMEDAQKVLDERYNLPPSLFGIFHNFCINSPNFDRGIPDVFCAPHTDAQNAAILVCAVLVYYYGNCQTNADERIWLVFWEAELIVQVPAGVVIIYPSALLLHFNVHIEDVLKVTKDGSHPTMENTVPFRESNTEDGGRGSIVWFTQASMLISAELPVDSVKQANVINKAALATGSPLINTAYNSSQALKDGLFPYDASATSGQVVTECTSLL